jgi:hypothetical protein
VQFFAAGAASRTGGGDWPIGLVVMVGMMQPGVRSSWNRVRNFKVQGERGGQQKRWQDQGGQLQAQLQHNQLIMQLWAKLSHTVSLKFSFFPHFLLQESL